MKYDYSNREIALYLRLSSADAEATESESIANQRMYLEQWAQKNGYHIIREFKDDGHTGTDFERPGFQQLYKQLKSGEIKCFVTTDLSRLGRNLGQGMVLVEEEFQKMGIRYIAVNDNYDSLQNNKEAFDPTPFKFLMNEFYAKDCSMKVLRSKRTMQREGKFLGGQAPYGYCIDPEDKYHLLIDTKTGPVVRHIFEEFLSGKSRARIADELTRNGVPTPSENKRNTTRVISGRWNATTLKRILSLPTYYGAVTQHTTEMISYKVHKRRNMDKSDWIVREGTHEGIVTKEEFESAQKMLCTQTYTSRTKKEHLLTGITYCADCGAKMYAHAVSGKFYMTCYTYSKNPGLKNCTSHYIREDLLLSIVQKQLQTLAEGVIDAQMLARQMCSKEKQDELKREGITSIKREIENNQCRWLQAYKDKADGLLTAEQFKMVGTSLEKDRKQLENELKAICAALKQKKTEEKILEQIVQFLQFGTLGKPQIQQLIKRIEVNEEKKILLCFSFKDPKKSQKQSR